jgi:hypothetical protein
MGREVRRVALDFAAPLGDTWAGYLRPADLDLPGCPDCCGSGATWASRWVESIAALLVMVGDDVHAAQRGRDLHPYLRDLHNRPYSFTGPRGSEPVAARPSADGLEFAAGLAGGPIDRMWGSSSSDWARAYQKIVAAAVLPPTWGICPGCSGTGEVATEAQRAAHNAWTPTEPPTGDGYQLWQTVSEGGPVSPVFETADHLAEWMVSAGEASSLPVAQRFVEAGWAPSGVWTPETGVLAGVELVGRADS